MLVGVVLVVDDRHDSGVVDLEDVDLTDYVVSQSLTIRTDVSGRRPEDETTVEARFALRVGVTSQGACNYLRREDEDAE